MQLSTISRLLAVGVASTLSVSLLNQSPVVAHGNHDQIGSTLAQASQTSCNDITFVWPVPGKEGEVSGRFDESDYHTGIDIDAPVGTPVVAAAAGEVIKAQWDDWGLGNAIKIRHDNGCYTVYGHNQENLVQVGQRVRQGEQIALMGATGFTDFSHLHFEVRPSASDFIDPMSVLGNASRTPVTTGRLDTNNPDYRPIVDSPATVPNINNPDYQSRVNPPATVTTACAGDAIISEETADFRIQIYQNRNQLFYRGENKRNGATICVAAQTLSRGRYQAQNGSYSYIIDANGYQVLRRGRLLREERFF